MKSPLAWYIAGPLIGLIVPILLILKEKQFGISSSYRFLGSKIFKKINYFNYDSKSDIWQFQFSIGLILAGIIIPQILDVEVINSLEANTSYGLIFEKIYSSKNILFFFIGGIFVGFGSRYANGCTAGHCIMGISQFSVSSIISTVCFFIGGLFVSYIVIPFLF
jgi:uncharacterized membrane protein YedE/YeeE